LCSRKSQAAQRRARNRTDISFVGISRGIFKVNDLLGDVTFRSVFGVVAGNLIAKETADRLAGAVLNHACEQKQQEYRGALSRRPGRSLEWKREAA